MMKKSTKVIAMMMIGIFLCMLDTTVMNIALPAIKTGLNTALTHLSWALNIYTVLFASLAIPLGRLADVLDWTRALWYWFTNFWIESQCRAADYWPSDSKYWCGHRLPG